MKVEANDVLLIIDVQNDFCPGGALAVADGDAVAPVINRLSRQFSNIVMTQDWHPPGHASFASSHQNREAFGTVELEYGIQVLWPDHCVQGSTGAAFHDALDVPGVQLIVRKGFRQGIDSYSAFFENDQETSTGLAGYLSGRNLGRVFAVGLATDFCVGWSCLDGRRLGYEMVLVEDACRAIDLDGSLDSALQSMRDAGVSFTTSAEIFG